MRAIIFRFFFFLSRRTSRDDPELPSPLPTSSGSAFRHLSPSIPRRKKEINKNNGSLRKVVMAFYRTCTVQRYLTSTSRVTGEHIHVTALRRGVVRNRRCVCVKERRSSRSPLLRVIMIHERWRVEVNAAPETPTAQPARLVRRMAAGRPERKP